MCLCASTILLYLFIPALYFEQKLVSDPSTFSFKTALSSISKLLKSQKLSYAHLTLTWIVIFSVKFSFIFFFKVLVKRLTNLNLYWRVVVWTNAVVFVLCICDIFIACPNITLSGCKFLPVSFSSHIDKPALTIYPIPIERCPSTDSIIIAQCWNDPHNLKPFIFTAIAISLDILTDVMIIAIPVRLLWGLQIRPRQKLRLGLSLCLSIFMIITALVKISGLRDSRGGVNMVWVVFWHYAEGCIAVLMISLTAFRSLFVSQNPSPPRPNISPSWSSKLRLRRTRRDQDLQWSGLPSIPPATLTGMRIYVGPSSGSPLNVEGPLPTHNSHISIQNGFSVESEPV